MKTSGKLFITTLQGDLKEAKVPYLKRNAKHGLGKETVLQTHGDLIVYR